ncbi:anthrone oxygenase family protein [Actinokineospora fastidiosa]|uniref:Membrane protein n=1 Tax=Actinokineospora fastidiosa TaxID=1816 RepID=A0A918GMA4_9PSEU|nr:anthrone oxygenase family protein [Actinokineospora fastidiosa]GGS47860.1 membrane protein [Actinokineospora fastidiosa]
MSEVVLIVTTVASGLVAGLFFAFSAAVMLALAQVDDRAFVDTMQRVNRRIQNPVFGLVFLAALVGSLGVVLIEFTAADDPRPAVLAGAVLTVSSMVVTFAVNIPLNNRLDAAGPVDAIADPSAVRRAFEPRWVRSNHVRTVLSTAGLALYCAGL